MMNLLVEPQRSYNRLWARHNLFYLWQFRRINHPLRRCRWYAAETGRDLPSLRRQKLRYLGEFTAT